LRAPVSAGVSGPASGGGRCHEPEVPSTLTRGRGKVLGAHDHASSRLADVVGVTGGISSLRYTAWRHGGQCRSPRNAPLPVRGRVALRSLCIDSCSCPARRQLRGHSRLVSRFGDDPAPKRNLVGQSGASASWRTARTFVAVLGNASCRLGNGMGLVGCSLTTSWLQRLARGIFRIWRWSPGAERFRGEAKRRR
jgi:hypothetical protein